MKTRFVIQTILALILLTTIIWYAFFQSKDLREGPLVSIEKPQNGFISEKPLVEITGSAEHISFLSLNGHQIYSDENGIFQEKLLIPKGNSIITVRGEDKFNRITEKQIKVFGDYGETKVFEQNTSTTTSTSTETII